MVRHSCHTPLWGLQCTRCTCKTGAGAGVLTGHAQCIVRSSPDLIGAGCAALCRPCQQARDAKLRSGVVETGVCVLWTARSPLIGGRLARGLAASMQAVCGKLGSMQRNTGATGTVLLQTPFTPIMPVVAPSLAGRHRLLHPCPTWTQPQLLLHARKGFWTPLPSLCTSACGLGLLCVRPEALRPATACQAMAPPLSCGGKQVALELAVTSSEPMGSGGHLHECCVLWHVATWHPTGPRWGRCMTWGRGA